MKIINKQGIRKIEESTCENQQISSIDLVERAANAVACEIISRFLPTQRIVVIAGPGNNGADALAVARMLVEQGYRRVEIFLFNVTGKLSHDCNEESKRLLAMDNIDFTEITREFNPLISARMMWWSTACLAQVSTILSRVASYPWPVISMSQGLS